MLKQNTAWHFKSKHYRKRRMNTKFSYSLMNATCCKKNFEENHLYHSNTCNVKFDECHSSSTNQEESLDNTVSQK